MKTINHTAQPGKEIEIYIEETNHIRIGEILSIKDINENWFRARVKSIEKQKATLFVFEQVAGSLESTLELFLLQAIPAKERMELIIEKAVELGVDLILPFYSKHSYKKEDFLQPKWHRWQYRAERAFKQSRRQKIPLVLEPRALDEAIKIVDHFELKLVLWEKEKELGIAKLLKEAKNIKSIALVVGPEGGFSVEEINSLKRKGFIAVSMGGRVLRTETAAIVGLALIQYQLGDLGKLTK